jgi:hypothetical protein
MQEEERKKESVKSCMDMQEETKFTIGAGSGIPTQIYQ